MTALPEKAREAWEKREGPTVFTTVDREGVPNTIYVTCVHLFGDDRIVVANNKFSKTLANIQNGCRGTILYITADKKAYQLKGDVTYQTDGDIYEDMKKGWLAEKYPGHGAAVLTIAEVYHGAKRLA
jgi:predicted pyridoxine 5'-phosphate oxidase superfamily flavin-nucleotide-binding protein